MLILSNLLAFSVIATNAKPMTVENLRCEYQTNPFGIDVKRPRLSWWLKSDARGTKQTAYQILVASSPELLKKDKGDLWDSGKVASDASIQVEYAGALVESGKKVIPGDTVYWKVRIWDQAGTASVWSAVNKWTVSPWQDVGTNSGRWMQQRVRQTFAPVDPYNDIPAPLFRKEFALPNKPIQSATLVIAGLGYFEAHLNGKKVGDHELDPGWTDFAKRVSYQSFDVTKQVKAGPNAIGVMLGNGFYNPLPLKMWGSINLREHLAVSEPRMMAQLEIRFADGTTQTVQPDDTWRVGEGPILRNSVYLGEVYDARREQSGWDKPGFDDANWETPAWSNDAFKPEFAAQRTPPIRITKVVKPVQITEPKPGVYVVDYGQNFAGVTSMRVKGSVGTRVRLRSGELLYDNGMLNGMTAVTGQIKGGGADYVYDGNGQPKTAFQLDEYVCKGEGVEVFQPRFTFHGFRYVEVTGYPGKPKLSDFEGLRMNSDVERVGSFECSNPMFNQIQTMMEWTLLSNLFSVQSDCPHREKFGYGGDQVATSEMAMYTFDMARFYGNTIDLLAEAQRENGGFTETAPFVGIADEGLGGKAGPIEWGSAHPLLVTQMDQYYGDKQFYSSEFIPEMRWLALLATSHKQDSGISDHESLAPKPQALTFQAYLTENFRWAAEIVKAAKSGQSVSARWNTFNTVYSGQIEDANLVMNQYLHFKDEFNKRFLKADGTYDSGTQACQSIPLALGFVPEDMKGKVLDVLIKDIEAHDYHLTTGIFGTKYLFQALSDAGRDDVAYRIVNQRTFPSYGHMIEKGATTLWEHWEFSDNTFSHNHPMFGSVSEWFYKSLLGIRTAGPGFKKIVIKPSVVGDLTWAKGHHDSPYGRIASSWKLEGKKLTMDVTIPPNTTATVYVPSVSGDVLEGGKVIAGGRSANGYKVFEVEPGTYRFESGL